MIFVLLSVLSSIIVAVIIRFARTSEQDVQHVVLWNYPCTVVLTFFLLKPQLNDLKWSILPFQFYIPLIILLPSLFIFIALAIKYSGIVKTDVAQRMSLFIPLIASFLLFGEVIQNNTLFGIVVGLIAVSCSISWNKKSVNKNDGSFLYPLIVFMGMGIIDILFKQIAQHKDVSYVSSMFIVFVGAMIFGILLLLWKVLILKERFDYKTIIWGSVLGLFNFANIFFYMKAHRALPDNPSIVFTTMNIGVIVLGSLVGVFLFKERLTKLNFFGLVLAIISIFLITYM